MDNFSEELEMNSKEDAEGTVSLEGTQDTVIVQENEVQSENSVNQGVEDIQFEEVFDIEEIQNKLQRSLSGENVDEINQLAEENSQIIAESNKTKPAKNIEKPVDPNSKKYVIYIDPENIKYMESLSPAEKKEVINKILKEQNEISEINREKRARTRYFKHAMLACITFIIGFPLMFILVNKSLESSINNYQRTKSDITKLYKDQGKIKMKY